MAPLCHALFCFSIQGTEQHGSACRRALLTLRHVADGGDNETGACHHHRDCALHAVSKSHRTGAGVPLTTRLNLAMRFVDGGMRCLETVTLVAPLNTVTSTYIVFVKAHESCHIMWCTCLVCNTRQHSGQCSCPTC
jgi:hypothetical protein